MVSISFRESLLLDVEEKGFSLSISEKFPSLSERAFFRTSYAEFSCSCTHRKVSISFRESLLSDLLNQLKMNTKIMKKFPSLSERAFFRTCYWQVPRDVRFLLVSISFRENLLSDDSLDTHRHYSRHTRFHLFQREPSFGQGYHGQGIFKVEGKFPSLSERTFFRTVHF